MFVLHFHLQNLVLVPLVLAVAFLLWVLWGMHRDSRR